MTYNLVVVLNIEVHDLTNLIRCGCDRASVIWISLVTIRCVLLSSFPLSIILTATRSVIKGKRNWRENVDGFLMVGSTEESSFNKFCWRKMGMNDFTCKVKKRKNIIIMFFFDTRLLLRDELLFIYIDVLHINEKDKFLC